MPYFINKKEVLISLFVFLSVIIFVEKTIAGDKKQEVKFFVSEDNRKWKLLKHDELHDPELEAVNILQQPHEALSQLPYDYTGNMVLWVKALREGYISPRTNIFPETKIHVLDMDIIMGNTSTQPMVRFPHREHTEWLDCVNCHNEIFIDKVDANPINMFSILQGKFCGRCHGAVSFPLTECNRCHSVDRATFKGKLGAQPTRSSILIDEKPTPE